jgi:hypothetical protein
MLQPTEGADMNDRDSDGEPTAVASDSDKTTIVRDAGSTQGVELAWSSEAETEELPSERRSWRVAWGNAAVLFVSAVLLAGVIVVGWMLHHGIPLTRAAATPSRSVPVAPAPAPVPVAAPPVHSAPPAAAAPVAPASPPAAPAPASPPPAAMPAPAPSPAPTPVASPPTITAIPRPSPKEQNREYVQLLTEGGLRITSYPAVIEGGHGVCEYLDAGHSVSEAIDLAMANNKTFTPDNAVTYVDSAVQVYCPRYLQ